ncbi:biotin-dependent carboxyltransferase family protein [Arcobacter defluvii]|uniref:Allophanate hydrolase, subunit 2 n=1 Tax=Arcobacter defluvii TaxID=873191 RepID=A0AAE7BHP1_9BACT|nr:biotin-dependent carboxyltransferase family protein [Arcobacter defluvii]QKF78074.1 allophanate hydrolase, subunit 2 [Arcobacter defluvii]RXI30019.1 urea amidolyase [Arcobacter defluvii]
MSLEIINNPLFVTIQDRGRFGYAHIGVTNSGVMDEYAYFWANRLLKNSLDTNILEIAFSNVIFKANENTQISITGASCEFFINDEKKELWQSYNIKKNDIIKIGKILSGNRVYLAVFGGFNIKKEFGSNSVTIKENLGGVDGNKLKKGDILPFNSSNFNYTMKVKEEFIPKYEDNLTLRVLFSYQENYFLDEEKKKFLTSTYLVTNDFNRMAAKLSGEAIKCEINGIISEAIAFGSIQIPSDGQPIVLLKDRQTIGGYPKIGVVLGIDCFKLSQAKANTKIRFEEISYKEAVEEEKRFYTFFS